LRGDTYEDLARYKFGTRLQKTEALASAGRDFYKETIGFFV